MTRRIPSLLVVLAAVVAIVVAGRGRTEADVATFATVTPGWMPSAPAEVGLTETWFCPGVPATGADGIGGAVVIANRSEERMVGSVVLISDRGESRRIALDVDGWSAATVDLDATLPSGMVGAIVEVEGGGAVVEQASIHPGGDSSAACANATSDVWYLADGFTVDGSLDHIVLANPHEQTAVANLEFSTREGLRRPAAYRGLTVPPESIRVIDLGAPGAGAQNEPVLAVKVDTSRGRLVVGRFQHFLGGGRLGTQTTVASPILGEQWWFVGSRSGPGVAERYSIFNPTDDAIEVDPIFVGIPTPVQPDPIAIGAHEVATFDPAEVADLPDGRYSVVFATLSEPSIVVERAMTVTEGDTVATSVVAGATSRPVDGHLASVWHVVRAPADPVAEALVVYTADNVAGTVSVSVVGSAGPVAVPALTDIPLPPPSGQLVIDLIDPVLRGRELIVESTNRVFVEQAFPTGRGDTRFAAWAIPAG